MRTPFFLPIAALGLFVQCGTPPAGDTGPADGVGMDDAVDAASDAAPVDVPLDRGAADVVDVQSDRGSEASSDAPVDAGPRTVRTLNEANPAMAMDLRGATNIVITSGPDYAFHPNNIRIRVGQTVTFRIDSATDWMTHPLHAGEIVDFNEIADPTSPIMSRDTGMADGLATFTAMGSYGIYCSRHYLSGHMGAIHVEP